MTRLARAEVPAAPTEFELNAIRNDPVRLATIRLRLSDLSWWMRLLCQYIAMRANGEDGKGLGRFWQGRYKAVRILDEESIDERKDPLGPHASRNGKRSSDKGFLAMAEAEYLEILDWLVRDKVAGKRGATPLTAPPALEQLGIEPTLWSAMVKDFGRAFMNVAGTAKSVSEARSRKTHRKLYRARV